MPLIPDKRFKKNISIVYIVFYHTVINPPPPTAPLYDYAVTDESYYNDNTMHPNNPMLANIKKTLFVVLLLIVVIPRSASAHEPRIVASHETVVSDPEISKAYYGQLTGVPDVFTIVATTTFDLYVNVLVPDIAGQEKDISASILKDGKPFAVLDGSHFTWTTMFEPFGYDTYWTGPEYRATVDAGTYTIQVTSATNDSKYSLAIGETENFDFKEIMNALTLVPQLKRTFFDESPISFILSPFGWGLILTLYVVAGIVGLVYRLILRKFTKSKVRELGKNIGVKDRLMRLVIGIALLLFAIATSWNILLIFLSGFAVFEALFSWCGLYAVLGRNTCPVE